MLSKVNIWHILLGGAVLRLLWGIVVEVSPVSDSNIYDEFARSIVEGRGFAYADGSLTAFWPPGTSALYAFLYTIFGYTYTPIVILNLAAGLANIYLTWDIARHYFSEPVARLAAVLMAVWPLLIQFTTILASEMLFIFLMLLAIRVFISQGLNLPVKALLFGVIVALCCYIRPIIVPFLVILPTLQLFRDRSLLRFATLTVTGFVILVVAAFPWSQRNTELFGESTMLSTNLGANLWMGNNPDSDGAYMAMPDRPYQSEKDRDNQLKQEAITFISENPVQFAKLALQRLYHTFSRETIGVVWNQSSLQPLIGEKGILVAKLFSTAYWLLMLGAAIAGVILTFLQQKWYALIFPPLVLSAFLFSIPLIVVGQDRYHIPMIPFIACFAAYFFLTLKDWASKRLSLEN